MEFSDRLKTLRVDRGYTQRTLGKIIGVSEVTIGNWERGVKQPSMSCLVSLANALHISMDSLTGMRGADIDRLSPHSTTERKLLEKYRLLDPFGKRTVDTVCALELERTQSEQRLQQSDVINLNTARTPERFIPLYATPSAAGFSIPLEGDDFEMILADEAVPAEADFAVWIQGDSMEPYIKNGEMVFINKDETPENGDVGIFSVDGAMYCKQFYRDEDGNVHLLSANPGRQDANLYLGRDSGQTLVAYGKVVMEKIPLPEYFTE